MSMSMIPQSVLGQYLEGAITFAELILWLAQWHVERETDAANLSQPECANCGGKLADRR